MEKGHVTIDIRAISQQLHLPPVKREDIIDKYEQKLRRATWGARVIGVLQSFTRFLALCNLTWATVVLLGGFVASLLPVDFHIVSCLLLIEAGRLASTVFFSRLVTRELIKLSQNPRRLGHKDGQQRLAWAIRASAQIGQIFFISPSLFLPVYRLLSGFSYATDVENLKGSLQIFYILVSMNAIIALVAVVCSVIILCLLYHPVEQSIQRYYDEVLQRGFDFGIVQADDFQFLDFAFKVLGQAFSRNVQPKVVQKHHKELIEYLYAHREGVDVVLLYLDWNDCFVQQAAVCVVGFWVDQKLLGLPVRLPSTLLTKLADKLGTGQIGWAAANSLSCLAKEDPDTVLSICNSSGKKVVDILIDLIDPSSSRSLVFVRALISLFDSKNGIDGIQQLEVLVDKLRKMLWNSKLQRSKVLAGYLLMVMRKLTEEDHPKIISIQPDQDKYFYRSEANMLDKLRQEIVPDLPPLKWDLMKGNKFEIKEEESNTTTKKSV